MISENAVASDRVTIAAPAELVWQVIVDFGSYGEWNTFCPSIEGKLALGEPLTMQVDLGNGLQEQVESITVLEPPRQIVWSMENKPDDPIHADFQPCVQRNLAIVHGHDGRIAEAVGKTARPKANNKRTRERCTRHQEATAAGIVSRQAHQYARC